LCLKEFGKKIKMKKKHICAVDYAFQRVGTKYKGRILLGLYWNETVRYGQFRKVMKDISTKMLTQVLRELEEDGLISREVYSEIPPRVEYSLTEEGKEFIPIVEHMFHWGKKKLDNSYDKEKGAWNVHNFLIEK